jgi:hypothetical protein
LLIGRVRNLSDSGVIPQAVDVEPAATLQKLETVAVLLIPRDEIHRQYMELNKAEKEKEKEKQDKTPGRNGR